MKNLVKLVTALSIIIAVSFTFYSFQGGNPNIHEATVTDVISDNLVTVTSDMGDFNLVVEHPIGVGEIMGFSHIDRKIVVVPPGGGEPRILECTGKWVYADGPNGKYCCRCTGDVKCVKNC